MDLFLDSNIYLSFYKLSDDDLEELEKLAVAVKSGGTTLYVTDQVRSEYMRNREAVIADSLKAFEGAKLPTAFPRLLTSFAEYDEMRQALAWYEEQRRELLKLAREVAAEKELRPDGLIRELFEVADAIPLDDDIWDAAKKRYDLGNPPGKKSSYGDAVNWESLMARVPDEQDLLFVTSDTDFISKLDSKLLLDVLRSEWNQRKHSDVILYSNLASLFKDKYPSIRLASELQKELAISALATASSFAETHAGIQGLARYSDFSPEQVGTLIQAANQNDQIRNIWDDEDVFRFFTGLARKYDDVIEPDDLAEFWSNFSYEDPEDERYWQLLGS
jgi:hypothetical protein